MLTAIELIKDWYISNKNEFEERGIQVEDKGELDGNGALWLYCPKHLIDISYWNHAYCLDILVFDSKTEEMIYSKAGSCENAKEFTARLNNFGSWYVSQKA